MDWKIDSDRRNYKSNAPDAAHENVKLDVKALEMCTKLHVNPSLVSLWLNVGAENASLHFCLARACTQNIMEAL